jgi:hypothetical protein
MKNKKINPVKAIAQMQKAKRGKAVGSMLEGGGIVFGRTPKELKDKAAQLKKDAENLKKNVVPQLIDEGRNKKANRKNFKADKLLTRADKLETKALTKKYKK